MSLINFPSWFHLRGIVGSFPHSLILCGAAASLAEGNHPKRQEETNFLVGTWNSPSTSTSGMKRRKKTKFLVRAFDQF